MMLRLPSKIKYGFYSETIPLFFMDTVKNITYTYYCYLESIYKSANGEMVTMGYMCECTISPEDEKKSAHSFADLKYLKLNVT